MSASPTTIPQAPALPDHAELSQQLPDWPNCQDILAHIEGVTGQMLFASGDLGETTLAELIAIDTRLKQCEPRFKDWYKNSPGWHAERSAEFWKNWRIGLLAEVSDARQRIARINSDFIMARNRAIEESRRQLEEQQRKQAEEERQREVEALKAQQTPEAEQAAEQRAQEPVIPSAISKEQAAVAAGVSVAPAKISGRKVYEREVVDMPAFLKWLAANPAWAGTLKVTANFTAMKSNPSPIPGVKISERIEVANRGK